MNYISWNVNGIRAWAGKDGVLDFLKTISPDVLCLQETKIDRSLRDTFSTLGKDDQVPKNADTDLDPQAQDHLQTFASYPYEYWNSAEKKGYSGTAVFSKIKPNSVSYGIGHELDHEGRVITLEFSDHYLVTVYTPNSKPDLSRLPTRYDSWDTMFLTHLKKLEKKKPVIVCGDFNAAHTEIDLKNDAANRTTDKNPGSPGFTDQERERFGDYLDAGFIDTFRHLYPETEQYTWWSYRGAARSRNVGWRIDYFLISQSLTKNLRDAVIYDDILGSDHCPVGLVMNK